MRITLKAVGVEHLKETLAGIAKTNADKLRAQVKASTETIAKNSRRRAPKKTGALKKSIKTRYKQEGEVGEVYSRDHKARLVEFGTGRRGEASEKPELEGIEHHYGERPGMSAQPYMIPALLEERPKFLAGIESGVSESIESHRRR